MPDIVNTPGLGVNENVFGECLDDTARGCNLLELLSKTIVVELTHHAPSYGSRSHSSGA